MAHTLTLPADVAQSVGIVGQVVTYNNRQYRVHSVEGPTFFAFTNHEEITVDLDMTYAGWLDHPVATLVPMGSVIGQGHSIEAVTSRVRRGVCLVKPGDGEWW